MAGAAVEGHDFASGRESWPPHTAGGESRRVDEADLGDLPGGQAGAAGAENTRSAPPPVIEPFQLVTVKMVAAGPGDPAAGGKLKNASASAKVNHGIGRQFERAELFAEAGGLKDAARSRSSGRRRRSGWQRRGGACRRD